MCSGDLAHNSDNSPALIELPFLICRKRSNGLSGWAWMRFVTPTWTGGFVRIWKDVAILRVT